MSLFMDDLNSCNAIVGHNVSFDIQVLYGEFVRLNIPYATSVKDLPCYCTMHLSVDYCKIPTDAAYIRSSSQYLSYPLRHPREYKYKYPKLIELYEFLFNERFNNAHDASADIEATTKCFFELLRRKVITYKSTDKTYLDIVVSKDKMTNILNDNLLSCVEKWKVNKCSNGWLVKAILKKDRIVKISFLYNLSDKGVLLDSSSASLLSKYGLSECDSFYINSLALLISKTNIARINVDIGYMELFDVHWGNNLNHWRTKSVRSFTKEEQDAIEKAEVVPSQNANSVCFFMNKRGQTYIPLLRTSSLTVGDFVDLKTAKLVTLCCEGKDDIYRVME